MSLCDSWPEGIAYPKRDTHKYYIYLYIYIYDLHDKYDGSDFDN